MSLLPLPADIINNSPSFQDNISSSIEMIHRVYGCELIQEAGILFHQPQVVMCTAQNIFHRFFYRKSFKNYDAFTVAMGCTLLASKIEEKPKIIRDIVFIFHHIYQKRKNLKRKILSLSSQRYTDWKNEVIGVEKLILKELGFSFYNIVDHPHKYLLYYVKLLDGNNELAQKSWNYLNDAMRLDLTLRYPAPVIASAAIHMASRFLNFPLPEEPYPWWKLMTNNFNLICLICDKILSLYHLPKLNWLEPLPDDVYYLSEEACKLYDEPYIEEIQDKIEESNDILVTNDSGDKPNGESSINEIEGKILTETDDVMTTINCGDYKPFHERMKGHDTKNDIIDRNDESRRKNRSRSRDRRRRSRSRSRDRRRRSRSHSRDRRNRSRSRSRNRYRRN